MGVALAATEPVVLVDDDDGVRRALERALGLEDFGVRLASGGEQALRCVQTEPPAAVVLDVGMPDLDGVAVVRRMRAQGIGIPVCMLSARDEVADRVVGLQAGADDYVVKPFAVDELSARLHALLRRRGIAGRAPLVLGDLVDPRRRVASRGSRVLELTRREFDLLDAFARHPGIVLGREQLLQLVWGYTFDVQTNVVDVFIGYLRRKLEADGAPRILHTVRGVGFVLRPWPRCAGCAP